MFDIPSTRSTALYLLNAAVQLAIFIVVLLGGSLFSSCIAQKTHKLNHSITTNHRDINHQIDSLIQLYAEYNQFSGTALVAQQGKVLYSKGHGLANKEWNINNAPNVKFRLASVTKQFTAMLVLQQVQAGSLQLHQPISQYLPDYPQQIADSVTIHHLLTHTSGIPNYTDFPSYRDIMRKGISPEELVQSFADSTVLFRAGERFEYSNSGYALLGYILETTTGNSFAELLKEHILDPLEMYDSGYAPASEIVSNLALGYDKDGTQYKNASYIYMSAAFTAGGMYSTAEDLFKWEQALYTDQLLDDEFREMLFVKHVPAWREHYGYGWFLGERPLGNSGEEVASIEHDGVINGFTSLILRIPSSQSTIILLNNTGGAPLRAMSRNILGILYGKAYDFPRKSIALELAEIINHQGLDEAITQYESLVMSPHYYSDERDMNLVAYEYLNKVDLDAAAFLFEKNVEAHPHAFNAHDSYGEVLLKMGKKEKSIAAYKKSIAYNPSNENGRSVLRSLGFSEAELDLLTLELLTSEKDWSHEIFHFPLRFAPEIPYQGREDARFPPGWRNTDSPEFWSYVIAWYVDAESEQTLVEIEKNLQLYFDGLMRVVNKEKDRVLRNTEADLEEEPSSGKKTYSGIIKIHDSFVTREEMSLYTKVESSYDSSTKKALLTFRFSPKNYEHKIWEDLENIQWREVYNSN